ncbi:MAG TPA: MAPEG family protein [Steroidobacteraceae bacterium]
MAIVDFVIGLALIEYFIFGAAVGRARGQFNVPAPATTGHPQFERRYRVQMNTLEQLIMFIPGMWAFARYVSPVWAAALGGVFIIGRALYYFGYVQSPQKRSAGFGISAAPVMILVLGGMIGAALSWYRG